MISCLLPLDVCVTISSLLQISCKHTGFHQKPGSSTVFKASALIHVSSMQGIEGERLMWHKIYLLPYIKKTNKPKTTQQHRFEWVGCLCIGLWLCMWWQWLLFSTKVWFRAWGTTPKVISNHDIKPVLPKHNLYQLLSFHQTFAGNVLFKECPALDLLWILAPCLAGLVLWKASGDSSWWAATAISPASLPHAEVNLVLE